MQNISSSGVISRLDKSGWKCFHFFIKISETVRRRKKSWKNSVFIQKCTLYGNSKKWFWWFFEICTIILEKSKGSTLENGPSSPPPPKQHLPMGKWEFVKLWLNVLDWIYFEYFVAERHFLVYLKHHSTQITWFEKCHFRYPFWPPFWNGPWRISNKMAHNFSCN